MVGRAEPLKGSLLASKLLCQESTTFDSGSHIDDINFVGGRDEDPVSWGAGKGGTSAVSDEFGSNTGPEFWDMDTTTVTEVGPRWLEPLIRTPGCIPLNGRLRNHQKFHYRPSTTVNCKVCRKIIRKRSVKAEEAAPMPGTSLALFSRSARLRFPGFIIDSGNDTHWPQCR